MKRALCVGINYPGTSHALKGCVNDVIDMRKLLRDKFGFDKIETITNKKATTKNIKAGLNRLVKGAKAGDKLFFHYSGHGSQMPDYSNEILEKDGLDEVIIPVDIDWRTRIIRDDDLKRIFNKVPVGVNLTVVIDACHSGSVMDHKNRFKPRGQARVSEVPEREVIKYLPPPPDEYEDALLKQKKRNLTNPAGIKRRNVDRIGLLISGCQSQQSSADALMNGKWGGACTKNLVDIVNKSPKITHKQLVIKLNNQLIKQGFTQRPELNGSSSLFDTPFTLSAKTEEVAVEQLTTVKPKPKPICRRCKKVKKGCRCPRWWKRYFWRPNGPWKRYYRILLRNWRRKSSSTKR